MIFEIYCYVYNIIFVKIKKNLLKIYVIIIFSRVKVMVCGLMDVVWMIFEIVFCIEF